MRYQGTQIDQGAGTKIRNELMKKLKIIQFGIGMLTPNDHHIKQILNSLDTITKYGKGMLEKALCFEGFVSIVEWIRTDYNNRKYTYLDE